MTPTDRKHMASLRPFLAALAFSSVIVLVIVAVHRESPRTLVSFHGLLHAAIADGFASDTRTSIPPENPFFAGEPLCYYWFSQFLAAQLVRVFSLNVFYALEAVTLIAAMVLCFSAMAIGRRIFRSSLAGCMIAYLVVAGTNPLGFLYAGARVARDGLDRLSDDPNYLWGVVHPLFGMIRFNDVGGLYGPLLSFFLNITGRPAALAGLLLWILALDSALLNPRRLPQFLLIAATALTTALSPVVGLSAAFALVVGLGLAGYMARNAVKSEIPSMDSRAGLIGAIVCIIVGLFVSFPTYYHLIFGPSASGARIWIASADGLKHLATIALSISPLLMLSYIGLRKVSPDRRLLFTGLNVAAVLLLGICAVIVLPAWNQSNCFHAAVVLLAVPASGAILCRDNVKVSVGRAVGISAVFLPTVLILVTSYWNRPSVPAAFDNTYITRTPADSETASLYRWVRTETSMDSVFIMDPRPPHVRLCGNISEFPAMTGRALFAAERSHYLVAPYADANRRVDLAIALTSGKSMTTSDQTYLEKLNRPLYVLVHRANAGLVARLTTSHGKPAFHQNGVAAFRVLDYLPGTSARAR